MEIELDLGKCFYSDDAVLPAYVLFLDPLEIKMDFSFPVGKSLELYRILHYVFLINVYLNCSILSNQFLFLNQTHLLLLKHHQSNLKFVFEFKSKKRRSDFLSVANSQRCRTNSASCRRHDTGFEKVEAEENQDKPPEEESEQTGKQITQLEASFRLDRV